MKKLTQSELVSIKIELNNILKFIPTGHELDIELKYIINKVGMYEEDAGRRERLEEQPKGL